MTVLNDMDRFHLVMDAIDRLPQTGDRGVYLTVITGVLAYFFLLRRRD